MSSGVLVINDENRAAIRKLIERARAKPIPIEVLKAAATPAKFKVDLADRKPGFEQPPSEHIMLGTYRATLSFEQQPAGLCAHLSVSSARTDKVPSPIAMQMVAREFGFTGRFPEDCHVWTEEFDPGHYAINMLWIVVPAQEGHA